MHTCSSARSLASPRSGTSRSNPRSILLIVLFLLSSYVLWGWRAATKYLAGTWLISYLAEYIGVETGYPFGHYAYTAAMAPFLGQVPFFIPFTWCALGYFCLQACRKKSTVVPALLMVVLDVAFDPVFSLTLWHWRASPGPAYFGVPALNFVGWFVTSIVIFAAFNLLARDGRMEKKKTLLVSGGTPEAVGFYFLLGMSTVPSLADSGFLGGAAISTALFVVVAALLGG